MSDSLGESPTQETHQFVAADNGRFSDTCRECGCFRRSLNHTPEPVPRTWTNQEGGIAACMRLNAKLTNLLDEAIRHLRAHDADYHYRTPTGFYERAERERG